MTSVNGMVNIVLRKVVFCIYLNRNQENSLEEHKALHTCIRLSASCHQMRFFARGKETHHFLLIRGHHAFLADRRDPED